MRPPLTLASDRPLLTGVELSDLRAAPQFAPLIADRVWRAWWQAKGVALAALRARVDESFGAATRPTTLVARSGDAYLGSVALIDSDVEERPAYTPWVAALWVEPQHRRAGLGTALTRAAAALALEHADTVYLAAVPDMAGFYRRQGWRTADLGVDGLEILSLTARG